MNRLYKRVDYPASNTAASSSNSNNGGVGHCSSISSSSRSATCPNTSTSKSGCMGAITSGGLLVPSSSNAVVAHNGASSQSSNNPGSSYWGTGAFIVQHKFTRAKSYYIDDEGKPKADPKQLRWSASDTEVMELVQGSGVYIKLLDLVNVYYRTKNAISAARRLLVCVFNDQTLMERSVKGSPDRPGLCPLTHQAILDCVEMISQCKPQDWAADETMINRSLIVRLCELRSKRTAKIYVTSQPNPSAHPAPFPEIHLS